MTGKTRPLIVQKYGGSSIATPDLIKKAAQRITRTYAQGFNLIVVVSAMGKTTDQLLNLAHSVSSKPNTRELDMLLTTGERVTMALLSIAIHDIGCPVISFTGSQAGVLTDNSFCNARIIDVKSPRVEEALKKNQIVILAGFQGVSPETKEITTLGRGGSDTTAVAMAGHFKAERCEILKDVDGVHSADPHFVGSAKLIRKVSYDSLLEMCYFGSKVLHLRSVELAKAMQVNLFVSNSSGESSSDGTTVMNGEKMFENPKVLSVNVLKRIEVAEIPAPHLQKAYEKVNELLDKEGLPWPQILFAEQQSDRTRMYLTNSEEMLDRFVQCGSQAMQFAGGTRGVVSVTCHGAPATDLGMKILEKLSSGAVTVEKMFYTPSSIAVVVPSKDLAKASEIAHRFVQPTN